MKILICWLSSLDQQIVSDYLQYWPRRHGATVRWAWRYVISNWGDGPRKGKLRYIPSSRVFLCQSFGRKLGPSQGSPLDGIGEHSMLLFTCRARSQFKKLRHAPSFCVSLRLTARSAHYAVLSYFPSDHCSLSFSLCTWPYRLFRLHATLRRVGIAANRSEYALIRRRIFFFFFLGFTRISRSIYGSSNHFIGHIMGQLVPTCQLFDTITS